MLGGWAVNGERITWAQAAQAAGMCVGVAIFSLADARESPRFSVLGLVCAACSVAASAVTGNVQKRAMGARKRLLMGGNGRSAEEPTLSEVLRGKGASSPRGEG